MTDITWLTREAHKIHDWFEILFYGTVLTFILLGVLLEYFKWPLGGVPSFAPLVGRALVASILLHSYPEVANFVSDLSSGASEHLGNLNEFKVVTAALIKKGNQLSFSWSSVRASIVVSITYLSFFLLYFSVHVAQAFYLYALVLLYVFSPILCALYVFPRTAPAASALYRSLLEVSCWKPVWCVIATLLWSTGVSDITGTASGVSFLSTICFCLIAAGSLLMTPVVVHALAGGGVAAFGQSLASIPLPGMGVVTAASAMATGAKIGARTYNAGVDVSGAITNQYFPRASRFQRKIPKMELHGKRPSFVAQSKPDNNKGD